MKFLAAILAFFVVALIAQPVFAIAAGSQSSECCAGSCGEEETEELPGSVCTDNCNPFQCQACCTGFVFDVSQISFLQLLSGNINHPGTSVPDISLVASDFWQPPRL